MIACAALPVGGRVTSPFGWRWLNGRDDLHTGVDVGAPEGTPVYAMLPGAVVVSEQSGVLSGYGDVLVLRHGPALYSLYAHLQRRVVAAGDVVSAGTELGAVGRTAGTRENPAKMFGASGAHLHLELLARWPPRGRDLDRLDPGEVLPQLGILVPPRGPLKHACAPGVSDRHAELPASIARAPASIARAPARAAGVAFVALAWLLAREFRA